MSANQTVSVHYRHVELQSGTALQETDDGRLFLALGEPPPVRTVLELREGSGGHAYEITAVVEAESPGVSRGCFVRRLDDAALKSRQVGSERLADASGSSPGSSSGSPTDSVARPRSEDGEERWSDEYGSQMAVPAPVVDPDGGDDSGETSEESSDSEDDASATSTDAGESARPGKKRRGRRRK